MNMIETVARALHEHGVSPERGYAWADASDGEKESARGYALAAIEAMKIPTEAMIGVGPEIPGLRAEIIATWTDMISKALEGGE